MRILMFGRGAIASAYGWALSRAGHEVEFFVRPGRAAVYGDAIHLELLDLRRRRWGERAVTAWPVRYREELAPEDRFDLIVVSVSHHRLAEAAAFLAPRIGDATVLILGNLWAEPLEAVAPLPAEQLAWGFPGAGGGFGADGVLRAVLTPSVTLGTLGQPPTPREQAVRRMFRGAGFRTSEQPDIRGWLWIHFVANAGMHAQGVRLGTLSHLVGSRRDLREALLATRELLPVVEKRGIDLRRHRAAVLPFRMPAGLTAAAMAWLTTHVAAARTSLAAQTDPTAEEPRAICRDALAEARRLGVPVPRLEAAEVYFAGDEAVELVD
ncbi:MAG: ketopantoate reductase [Leifsonia xyli]|nr:MAG: ketopantoate reductase [Leifsonia xyli]